MGLIKDTEDIRERIKLTIGEYRVKLTVLAGTAVLFCKEEAYTPESGLITQTYNFINNYIDYDKLNELHKTKFNELYSDDPNSYTIKVHLIHFNNMFSTQTYYRLYNDFIYKEDDVV